MKFLHALKEVTPVRVTCVLSGFIVLGSLMRGTPLGTHLRTQQSTHAVVHFLCFSVLTSLYIQTAKSLRVRVLLVGGAALLAAGSEYLQHLLGHFPVEISDIAINLLGVLAGATVWILVAGQSGLTELRLNSSEIGA